MRTPRILLVIFLGLGADPGLAEGLPPLGRRVYLLDKREPSRPIDIRPLEQGAGGSGRATMRDPLPPGAKELTAAGGPSRPAASPRRVSRMSFDKVAVQGRYLVPRVIFDRPALELGRREEPVQQEYRKKIIDSERELREFDW